MGIKKYEHLLTRFKGGYRMRFWRNFILFSGIVMQLLGVWIILNPARISISLIGIIMISAGLILLADYLNNQHEESQIKWVLAEGTVTFLLGAMLFINNNMSNHTLNFMFGVWLLFLGCIRIIAGLKAKKLHMSGWMLIFAIGILTVLTGFIPFISITNSAILISLFFIMEGFNTLSAYHYLEKL